MTDFITPKVWVVIPAAGIGKRMESELPKQYLRINNKTVIEHTLDCFMEHPDVAGIIVALNTDDINWNSLKTSNTTKPIYTVEGGKERYDSVLQALEYLQTVERAADNTWVMVHDAARPCLSKRDIDSLLELRATHSIGGILATPVRDTMKRAALNSIQISRTESRQDLWHALTPQLFKLGRLKSALETCFIKGIEVTDESSAIEAQLGDEDERPMLVEGSSNNIKITRSEDLELATLILSKSQSSKGQ